MATAPCLGDLACGVFVDDYIAWAEVAACWEQAKLSVEVTPRDRAFCADYARAWFECGFSFPIAECEVDYARSATSVLDKLTSCAGQATCAEFLACDAAAKKPP